MNIEELKEKKEQADAELEVLKYKYILAEKLIEEVTSQVEEVRYEYSNLVDDSGIDYRELIENNLSYVSADWLPSSYSC